MSECFKKSPYAREASPPPRAGDGDGGVDGLPRLQVAPPYASIETAEATPRWVRFIRVRTYLARGETFLHLGPVLLI